MNLGAEAPTWLFLLLCLLLAAAATEDAIRLRISNVISALVGLTAIFAAFMAGVDVSVWQNFAVLVALLAVGTMLFAIGKLGGGDIKLFAASGLWFGFSSALQLIASILIAGGILAVLVLAIRAFSWSDAAREKWVVLRPKGGIPYGVAIAVGAIIAVLIQRS